MIDWTYDSGVYELTLATPPCNEIGTAMLADLRRFIDQIDRDAHTLILRSGLRQGFCAGADLRELYRGLSDVPAEQHAPLLRKFIDEIHGVMDDLDMLPLTTVGVVHGVCFGGGFELALTCDVLIAEKSARFCFPELRLGIIPGFGGIPRLRRDVGNGLIRDLLLSGRSINAKKAQAAGLVSQVVAGGEGITAARALAAQTAKFDPTARKAAKAFIKKLPTDELLAERELFVRLAQGPALLAALKRFVESTDLRPYLP
ncbi:enoyl-CoA hydratase/isomerase family protein [Nannocystis pusilla]|uniref:Enoyl-CoA hydratase/isomerase family protein n=1 Tax=Nannocystis pusilla TaxID=889268 RepID=A0ABS7U184_9BACT|nr:enoyl-CoA hydratase/isomerase family protein [Nannocystis pusilla]MBZ5714214.1 enoyl-CoA hydratase/isomerase family protein [Nannocystis pusilla]